MRKKVNFASLVKKLETERKRVSFLQEVGILKKNTKCEQCNNTLSDIKNKKKLFLFFCSHCKKKSSIRTGSILSGANICLRKLVLLLYIFISNFWTYKQIREETDILSSEEDDSDDSSNRVDSSVLGKATISRYFTAFWDIFGMEMLKTYNQVKTKSRHK